jgi:hypothetical protein
MIFFSIQNFMVLSFERERTKPKPSTLSSNWNNYKEAVKQKIPMEANYKHEYNSRYTFRMFL